MREENGNRKRNHCAYMLVQERPEMSAQQEMWGGRGRKKEILSFGVFILLIITIKKSSTKKDCFNIANDLSCCKSSPRVSERN